MRFANLLDSFRDQRVLVIGDVMLDQYVFGTIDRISPEAPVMVVNKTGERYVPGGAANVAKNAIALGSRAGVAGAIGKDSAGQQFLASLKESPGLASYIVESVRRPTTCKTRIIANHSHQVLRIDEESTEVLDSNVADDLLALIKPEIGVSDCIVLSDYRKGVLTRSVIDQVICEASKAGKPVIVNAKPNSSLNFSGASLMTLNRKEAEIAWSNRIESPIDAEIASKELREKSGVNCVAITMGEFGIVATWDGETAIARAPQVEAYDVAGAGDTALATLALGVASVGFHAEIFELAVQTAARVVQHVGVAVPSSKDLESIRSLS